MEYDNNLDEYENMINKSADIRELIWEMFPENQGEMIACPYSVLCYAEDFIKKLREVGVIAMKDIKTKALLEEVAEIIKEFKDHEGDIITYRDEMFATLEAVLEDIKEVL